jgi:hypothetical protein
MVKSMDKLCADLLLPLFNAFEQMLRTDVSTLSSNAQQSINVMIRSHRGKYS